MKKANKITAVILSAAILLNATPVMAASSSIGSIAGSTTIGEDTAQGAKTKYEDVGTGNVKTEVYLTVAESNLIVSTPTTIILNGAADKSGKNTGEYSVSVSGDMQGDKTLCVEPDSTLIQLHQKGKNDISAEIHQEQTDFSYEDLANNKSTTGTITAEALTAGSWNSSFNFNISIKSMYHYYSSVEAAAVDASNNTYDNADLESAEDSRAVASLINTDNKAEIRLLKDVSECKSFTLGRNTDFNLSGYTISFSEGSNLTYEKDLTIENGTLESINKTLILGSATNTNSTFVSNNVKYNLSVNTNAKSSIFGIENFSKNNITSNTSITALGEGNNNSSVIGIAFKNTDNISTIEDYNFNSTVKDGKNITGIQSNGNTNTITNTTININANSVVGTARGMMLDASDSITVNMPNIKVNTVTGSCHGILFYSKGDNTINGADIYISSDKDQQGLGIAAYKNANLTINSTNEHPVTVFAKQWGIQTSPLGKTVINGGTYTATDHTAYIEGNADINNAEFHIANRNKYESQYLDSAFGLYLGGTETPKNATVNFNNCVIGNKPTDNYYPNNTVSAKSNDNYIPISNINFYDCTLYESRDNVFSYNYATKNNTNNAKFNLYGDTKIIARKDRTAPIKVSADEEIPKELLKMAIDNWKLGNKAAIPLQYIRVWNADTTVSDSCDIGALNLIGGYVAKATPFTYEDGIGYVGGEIEELYVTEDANVYDYR